MGPVDLRLGTLVEGDVLPSVSRREPLRKKAKVWTSANRIFDCARPDLLARVLEKREAGEPVPIILTSILGRRLNGLETKWAEECEQQLLALERLESEEYHSLYEHRIPFAQPLASSVAVPPSG